VMVRSPSGRFFRGLSTRLAYGSAAKSQVVVVQAATDVMADEELLDRYRTVLAVALGIALLVCAGAGYRIVQAGLRPVRRMAQAADEIGSSTLDKRLDTTALPGELRDLATTFNGMLGRLEDSFDRLRRFSDDIAHELRTPINRILVATEVVLGRARTVEEYREVLASNIEDCGRLARLVQSLLFLARSESPHAHIEREWVDLAHELAAIREFYEAAAAEKGVGLSMTCDPGLAAELDRSLLHRAVGNLVENAVAHTPRGGSVVIAARNAGDSLTLEISDTGCGIASEHLPRLFDRFYRVDGNRPTRGGNAGLGLAIVKSIAMLHDGTVEIASAANAGTHVVLRIPIDSSAG
ncbi:MAG: heavy metal sensor histidine kinase, partial [Stellaceae bacterium]